MTTLTVKVLKVSGLDIAGRFVGLPVGKALAEVNPNPNYIPPDKLATLSRLVKAGDEHAKILRQVVAWFEITAPRYWWAEMDTYRAGGEGYSASTMHVTPRDIGGDVNDAVDERVVELYNILAYEISSYR